MLNQAIPRIDQLGFVVRDFDAALDHWIKVMKVGPFFVNSNAPLLDFTYKGKGSSGRLDIASSNLGDLQIEIIACKDNEPSAFRDFLDRGFDGLQHVGYMTEKFDETYAACEAAGMSYVQGGQSVLEATTRYCYMAPNAPTGAMVEIIGIGPRKKALFDFIRQTAKEWDGRDPIRALPTP